MVLDMKYPLSDEPLNLAVKRLEVLRKMGLDPRFKGDGGGGLEVVV